jgi:hypothetical protein
MELPTPKRKSRVTSAATIPKLYKVCIDPFEVKN